MSLASQTPQDSAQRATTAQLSDAWRTLVDDWTQWWRTSLSPAGAAFAATAEPNRQVATPFVVPPDQLARLTADYQSRLAALWQAVMATSGAQPLPEIVPIPAHDRRFRAPAWRSSPFHSLMLQSYLLHAWYLNELVAQAQLPEREKKRLAFATRQMIDALAPVNFAATNPEVVERALATRGATFVQGMANLAADLRRGRITMSDAAAFAVGRNIAVTPGSVVFRNDLVELIQYAPTTETVHARPLVIVPPCINKYYILDLTPANSFVRHAVAMGHTTFIISWRNIPRELGGLRWDDYLESGVLEAVRVACAIADGPDCNALGFCVGGTLLASALAVLAARGDTSVASATFLTTMLDFDDPGDIGVYVSEAYLAMREPQLLAGARLQGGELAGAFASLRPNELVWNYVVNNYLKGETPPPFDLLHWNGDSANLPGPMYAYYLREMYLNNRLCEPEALTMLGESIDLGNIELPSYVVATHDDHIVPWRSAYKTTTLVPGARTFVLGASGHIAGVVNPVESGKRNHWVDGPMSDNPDEWLAGAHSVPGSW
ncbi:MAG TPA: alpha/beta fold hydrolase, partial [Casimicrobiaceae bacterium]|nr:alpha/beta fold hydrolase [Casimicrobiaceae bacterium]